MERGVFRSPPITERKNLKIGTGVQLYFEIQLNEKDKAIIEEIRNLFSVGSITLNPHNNSVQFRVISPKDFRLILEHFSKFPLNYQKRADYNLFLKVIELIESQ